MHFQSFLRILYLDDSIQSWLSTFNKKSQRSEASNIVQLFSKES